MSLPSRYLLAVVGCSCIAFSSCGGDDSGPSTRQAKTAPPSTTTDTQGGVQLEDLDGRLGGAVTADAEDKEQILEKGGAIPDDLAEPPSDDTGVGAGGACPDPELAPAADNMARISTATLCLMNSERRKQGLPPLASDAILARASRGHSADMVKRSYFAHDSPEGRTVVDRLRAARYIPKGRGWTVGENLAWGSGPLGSPRAIVQAWLDSPGHRKNLLSPRYSAVGLGIVHGSPQDAGSGATFTTDFGRKG